MQRLVVLFLAVALVLCAFAGCRGRPRQTDTQESADIVLPDDESVPTTIIEEEEREVGRDRRTVLTPDE